MWLGKYQWFKLDSVYHLFIPPTDYRLDNNASIPSIGVVVFLPIVTMFRTALRLAGSVHCLSAVFPTLVKLITSFHLIVNT